tara:strand:- start:397 stop:1263 length:867 start_codon:yes stop_codon:yes gene_type:complete
MYSMTGFARVQAEISGVDIEWEIRSLNHRYLEAQFKIPENLRSLEPKLRETLKRQLSRGKVDCSLKIGAHATPAAPELNLPVVSHLISALHNLRAIDPSLHEANVMDVLRWPGVLGHSENIHNETFLGECLSIFESTLTKLLKSRAAEGQALIENLIEYLTQINLMIDEAAIMARESVPEAREKIARRISDLKPAAIDSHRLEQEIALLAQKSDVTEELDRLRFHVKEALKNIQDAGPQGRRLDFIAQEMGREANTLAAKAANHAASKKAVDLKVAVEQIREQIQNLE